MGRYSFRPISLREANRFVGKHHRHNRPVRGCKFTVSVVDDQGQLVGVGIAGRPVARLLDDGKTLEITRVCVLPGQKNVCSMIYACLRMIGKAMGYERIITYTLASESGASLRAVSATPSAPTQPTGWDRKGRSRREQPIYYEDKIRWLLYESAPSKL